jgi:hypothetical protein
MSRLRMIDKELEAKAKAAVRLQIEVIPSSRVARGFTDLTHPSTHLLRAQADKKARAEKAAREKALRAGGNPTQAASSSSASGGPVAGAASVQAAASGVKGDYPETRLQVSLTRCR